MSSLHESPPAAGFRVVPFCVAVMRIAARALLLLVALFCILLLVLRYWVLPDIDSHRGRIIEPLRGQIGQSVEIGQLALLVAIVTLLVARVRWQAHRRHRHHAALSIGSNQRLLPSKPCSQLLLIIFSSLPDRPRQ